MAGSKRPAVAAGSGRTTSTGWTLKGDPHRHRERGYLGREAAPSQWAASGGPELQQEISGGGGGSDSGAAEEMDRDGADDGGGEPRWAKMTRRQRKSWLQWEKRRRHQARPLGVASPSQREDRRQAAARPLVGPPQYSPLSVLSAPGWPSCLF
jgi:hypothetical protein